MVIEYFVDTSYFIALAHPRDEKHDVALSLSRKIEKEKARLITTQAIVLELGSALARQKSRVIAARIFEAIDDAPVVEVVPLSLSNYRKSIDLFSNRMDKDWSLTDCLSFVVMKEIGISKALTTDEHFSQAGFEALLL